MNLHPCNEWFRHSTRLQSTVTLCVTCEGELPRRKTRFCSGECKNWMAVNHLRPRAVIEARKRDGDRCRLCRAPARQVNHIVPMSLFTALPCSNHQSNLETLCDRCHIEVTVEQYAAGLVTMAAVRMAELFAKSSPYRTGTPISVIR